MLIKIVSVQRHPQKEILVLEQDYLKRLERLNKTKVITLRPKSDAEEKHMTVREEEKLIQKELADDDKLVVLEEQGREFSTKDLAQFLDHHRRSGTKSLTFLVGGPQGISEGLKSRAGFRWSLSKLTLPHRLVRLILLEALYRSFDVLGGGPYHK